MFRNESVISEYEHHLFMRSYDDLEKEGIDKDGLSSALINAVSEVYYQRVSTPSAKVFIDKTPRYSVICNEIIKDFSNDYHILLFRHPLACVSSMINTFGGGNWCLYRFDIDIFLGLPNLIKAAENHQDLKNLSIVRYEDFVANPESYYQFICSELDVDPENKVALHEKPLAGTLGDPVGEKRFGKQVVSPASDDLWNVSFNTFYRRWWAKNLLRIIGKESFALMGYDFSESMNSIGSSNYSIIQEIRDIPFVVLGFIHRHTGIYVTYVKIKRSFSGAHNFGGR